MAQRKNETCTEQILNHDLGPCSPAQGSTGGDAPGEPWPESTNHARFGLPGKRPSNRPNLGLETRAILVRINSAFWHQQATMHSLCDEMHPCIRQHQSFCECVPTSLCGEQNECVRDTYQKLWSPFDDRVYRRGRWQKN